MKAEDENCYKTKLRSRIGTGYMKKDEILLKAYTEKIIWMEAVDIWYQMSAGEATASGV